MDAWIIKIGALKISRSIKFVKKMPPINLGGIKYHLLST